LLANATSSMSYHWVEVDHEVHKCMSDLKVILTVIYFRA
jgi:hypothetical protein